MRICEILVLNLAVKDLQRFSLDYCDETVGRWNRRSKRKRKGKDKTNDQKYEGAIYLFDLP